MKEGIQTQRINLHNGFDLYKDSTYAELRTLFLRQRPKKVWVSTTLSIED